MAHCGAFVYVRDTNKCIDWLFYISNGDTGWFYSMCGTDYCFDSFWYLSTRIYVKYAPSVHHIFLCQSSPGLFVCLGVSRQSCCLINADQIMTKKPVVPPKQLTCGYVNYRRILPRISLNQNTQNALNSSEMLSSYSIVTAAALYTTLTPQKQRYLLYIIQSDAKMRHSLEATL